MKRIDFSKYSKSDLCRMLVNTVRYAKKLPLLPVKGYVADRKSEK